MNDRELLIWAAKAAGVRVPEESAWSGVDAQRGVFELNHDGTKYEFKWNPLIDDGDALRLAVHLRITPHIDGNLTDAESTAGFCTEPHFSDPYAATRRAITRAAAEIGRAMG